MHLPPAPLCFAKNKKPLLVSVAHPFLTREVPAGALSKLTRGGGVETNDEREQAPPPPRFQGSSQFHE